MSLSPKYDPVHVEDKWYQYWMENGYFKAKVDANKVPYSIVIPPPNVTGVLHMGHMLNNTIQDILIRKARMEGKEACWVPGTDHASIATEAKVVRMLREKGIKKSNLSREDFLGHAWDWKEKYGGIILEQLKKLGASCDWDRTAFTMDDDYYKGVIRVFVDLYRKGYIYRGLRMINWDVEAKTAVSNEEVVYKEEGETATLYYVCYDIKDSNDSLTIATVRPETILGDSAIAINPKDERHAHLIGKKAIVPFVQREIPIIGDEYVELDFGTGCLKVTPAHDPNDYEIGQRHDLEVIDTLNPDGTLNKNCGVEKYLGMDRFECRKLIVKDLKAAGKLVKQEDFTTRIGRSERTNTVIEPKLSLQWFINMKDISRKAHQAVMDDEILLYPPKFKNTYNHWMENVKDWCISRQLWWGHRIPAYFYGDEGSDFVVAETLEEAIQLASEASGRQLKEEDLHQDEDVLDTWASSWLFPLAVFDGFKDEYFNKEAGTLLSGKNKELDYFYPTDTLVTAPEILFFWVARMIIAGYEYTGQKPFKQVYLTGIVRDKLRRKMSKSLGNSPDPLDLIAKYGADGVRTGMLFSSPAGNDLLFDEKLVEQGRNFANKIWNAFRLIKSWKISDIEAPSANQFAVKWMIERTNEGLTQLEDHFSKFRMSDALMTIYKLIWNDFCSWYLEWIKPSYGAPIDKKTYNASVNIFSRLMRALHPFMPFITEELWHNINEEETQTPIIISEWPEPKSTGDDALLRQGDLLFEIVQNVRNLRNTKQISPKESLKLVIHAPAEDFKDLTTSLQKLANLSEVKCSSTQPENAFSFVLRSIEYFLESPNTIDAGAEKEALEKELSYAEGFLKSVDKKLSNERFVNNAPAEVVEVEKKKKADTETKIQSIKEAIKKLGS